jgi:hypothetical protein
MTPKGSATPKVLGSNPSIGEHRKTDQTRRSGGNQSRNAKEIKFRRIGFLLLATFLAGPRRIFATFTKHLSDDASRTSEASAF